jgi:hypothetical protein
MILSHDLALPLPLPHFLASDFLLVGGVKPEKAADCAYASCASAGARDGELALFLEGGARLEKAADCAYALSDVSEGEREGVFCCAGEEK